MVCNLADLDGFVQREIVERFDVQNLNMIAGIRRHGADNGESLHRDPRYCASWIHAGSSGKGAA